MQFFLTRSLWIRKPRRMAIALSALLLVMAVGCPMTEPGDNGDGTNGTDALDQVAGEILTLRNNQIVSALETSLAIFYSITGMPPEAVISAFFVTVPDPGTTLSPQDSRVVFQTNLVAGESQAFVFNPNNAGTGFHRLGLLVRLGDEFVEIVSAGVVVVEGGPDPRFVLPPDAITVVTAGNPVPVTFDAGDPQDDVAWRLFLLSPTDRRDDPADVLGEELITGFGNIGQFTLSTIGRPAGRYELGLSATDSGLSIAATVADGKSDLIVTTIDKVIDVIELVDIAAPTFAFTAPGLTDVNLFGSQEFTIRFEAAADPAGGIVEIDIFVDDDCNPSNGKTRLNNEPLPVTATTIALPTDLAEGTYCVIGEVRQATRLVEVTAAGRIIIARSPTLTVLAPDTALPIGPTDTIEIRWTTNVPEGFGLIDVFARTLDAGGEPSGSEIPITPESQPTTVTSWPFSRTQSGVYQINVRLTLSDPSVTFVDCPDSPAGQCVKTSPRPVRVSTVPPIIWVGELAKADPAFDGAIFEGVNFEDNAGSTLAFAGDLNADELDDFVIGARYGKPFFVTNPSAVGPGEAYLIFGVGGAGRPTGVFNLNTVGTDLLPGILLTGVRTVSDDDDTDGLSEITRIPDADGDGVDELVFAFPRTNSAGGTGPLEAPGQFLNGGVVILSSDNSLLQTPTNNAVIDLSEVGQRFSNMTGNEAVVVDSRSFDEDLGICAGGSDGVEDTIVGPAEGFIPLLAPSQLGDFVPILPGTTESVGVCLTDFPNCADGSILGPEVAGSGFYPDGAAPLEPRGARILGPELGSGFGTSVTFSNAFGGTGRSDIIISAPNRNAEPTEVSGISSAISDSGLAYIDSNRLLWDTDNVFPGNPPTPNQYVMGLRGHCGIGRSAPFDPLHLAGRTGDKIQNILGIDDFNGDGRDDIAVGAPQANTGSGRVYVVFRRDRAVEGDFVLDKLALDLADPERLTGALIAADATDALGSSMATGVDFNRDGIKDLVIGSPNADGGIGEVIVIFGDPNLRTPEGGISIDVLLSQARADGSPRAVRITGNGLDLSGHFGFNVANAGDVDGDGFNDLLIAAPGATPRFDRITTDDDDTLTDPGIDADFDGVADVICKRGVPNFDDECPGGAIDTLEGAGLVYIIYGSNRLDQVTTCTGTEIACEDDIDCAELQFCDPFEISLQISVNINQLGKSQLRGFMIAGRREGDRIGGGDAGSVSEGGIPEKNGRGRSNGLASAGDVDGDGRADMLVGAVLADPRIDPETGDGLKNGGECYLIYGSVIPSASP